MDTPLLAQRATSLNGLRSTTFSFLFYRPHSFSLKRLARTVRNGLRESLQLGSTVVVFSYLTFAPYALAAPTGGQVVGGSGNINQSGLTTTVNQASQKMAIDWQSFNVNKNETVQFIQPGQSAVVLNRILGSSASQIRGQIKANGQVILVNPSGVFFSPTSVVNVGGIIASGLDLNPADFMNGNYIFNEVIGREGNVINSGIINAATGGNVALIGKHVINDGLIVANLGSVALAAGKQAVLTFDNNGLIGVKVSKAILQDELGLDPAVINRGDISAHAGRVLLSASVSQDIFSQAVNTDGLKLASSAVVNADGSFTLGDGADVVNRGSIDVSATQANQNAGQVVVLGENVTHSGDILADAANGNGGDIELHAKDTTLLTDDSLTSAVSNSNGHGGIVKALGDNVGLFDQAKIDASGAEGGGQVYVGGGQTGTNPHLRNAQFIFLNNDSQIKADGLNNSDGGTVITFAEDTAKIHAHLSAKGGTLGGDGGFIETSGLKGFKISRAPDVSAPMGSAGEWLIDPNNITIIGGSVLPPEIDQNGNVFSSAGEADATLGVDLITDALKQGASVTITTSAPSAANATNPLNGTIKFNVNLDYDGNRSANTDPVGTLTLNAANNIDMNSNAITDSNPNNNNGLDILNIIMNADTDGNGVGDVLLTNSEINTNGGSFTATGVNFTSTRTNANNGNNNLQTNGGNVTLAMSGVVTLGAEILTGGGDVIIGNTTAIPTAFSNAAATGTIDSGTGSITLNTRGTLPTKTGVGAELGNLKSDGNITVTTSGGDIIQAANTSITNSANNAVASFTATGNAITLNNSSNDFNQVALSGNTAEVTDSNDIQLGNVTLTGSDASLSVTAGALGNSITQAANTSITNNTTGALTNLVATNGTITLKNSGNDFTQLAATAGDIAITDSTGLILGNLVADKPFGTAKLDITAGGNISQAAGSTITTSSFADSQSTFTALDNSITLDNSGNNFDQVGLQATSATLRNSDAITFADVVLTGSNDTTFKVTSGGNIDQLTGTTISNNAVGAISDFTANGFAIDLRTDANDFTQVNLNALTAGVFDANSITLGNITTTGTNSTSLAVKANAANNGGDILQASGTTISNKGTKAVTRLRADNGNIVLDQDTNDFTTVEINNAARANLHDANGIELGNITLTGNNATTLDVTAKAGTITQATGTAIANSALNAESHFSALGNNITLDNANNDFTQVALDAGSAKVTDINGLQLGNINITGGGGETLRVRASNGSISQASGTAIVNNASGAMTNLIALNNAVTLSNNDNDFNQVSVSAGNTTLTDKNAIVLGDVILSDNSGTSLKLTANAAGAGGGISQLSGTKVENKSATSQISALGQSIVLENATNDFAQVELSAASAALRDSNDIKIGNSTLTGTGGTTLKLTASGEITQATNSAIKNAGAGAITRLDASTRILLAQGNNDFNQVYAKASDEIRLTDSNALTLGDVLLNSSNGALHVTSNGALTQLGGTRVENKGSNAVSYLTANNSDIVLDNTGNDFNLLEASGVNLSLKDTNSLTLQSINASNTLTVQALNNGDISQSGAINITGLASFILSGGKDLVLEHSANQFNGGFTASAASGRLRHLSLNNNAATQLAGLDLSGNLTLTANGLISDSAAIVVDGQSKLDAGSADIQLDNANNLNHLWLNAANVSLNDINGINFGDNSHTGSDTSHVTGNLTLTTAGQVTDVDNDTLQVGGTLTINAGANHDVILDGQNNDFNSVLLTNAHNVSLHDVNHIDLGSSTLTGTLAVNSGGNITNNNGALSVAGTASFTAMDQGQITLANTANTFAGDLTFTTADPTTQTLQDVTLFNTAATTIDGNVVLGNNLSVTSGGALTFNGALQVGNLASLDAAGQDLNLIHNNNDLNRLSVNANSLTLHDRNAVTLENIKLDGDLTGTATGMVLGSIDATKVDLDAGSGGIGDANGAGLNIKANQVKLRAATGIGTDTQTALLDVINTSNTGSVSIRNHGNVTVSNLVNPGNISFTNTGNVTVDRIDAGYTVGNLLIQINNGSLFGIGPGRPKADLTAYNALINIPSGSFGTPQRRIIVSVKNEFTLFSQQSYLAYIPVKPKIINDNSTIKGDVFDALSSITGQQLLEVESLEDLDPAIFTQVKNYNNDNIAIKLPKDQLYEEDTNP